MDMQKLYAGYKAAADERGNFEEAWDECARYAAGPSRGKAREIYDATASIAAENLASSLLSQLTPPWSRWLGLEFCADGAPPEAMARLEQYARIMASHFERSNFYAEAYQCYFDLVIFGTACMLFEEEAVGAASAFRFSSVPLRDIALAGEGGRIDGVFRTSSIRLGDIRERFPEAELAPREQEAVARNPDAKAALVESALPRDGGGFDYAAFIDDTDGAFPERKQIPLEKGLFPTSPFIVFRWLKTSGELYGVSPVMKALPDIKTANRAVELMLKNASIAVAGVWQADDDGVINIDSISLEPGTIIAKAVGSSGLTPLRTGADFDISQLVLGDLRTNINRALLADRLASFSPARMTATEIVERADETGRILGATYGRLQSEFIAPLAMRAAQILKRRGELGDIAVNGREVDFRYRSPLAQSQAMRDARGVMAWAEACAKLGDGALAAVDKAAVARFVASSFGV
ncbi:MAG: head-tail connector protein, partial [Rickettsiales bacterium]|nr:head-tail connector protein [Rickettsiales bacterium]